MIYVNLESALFQTENDNFHVKTAGTPEEITRLLEVGLEYVCQKDGLVFPRKRKQSDMVNGTATDGKNIVVW